MFKGHVFPLVIIIFSNFILNLSANKQLLQQYFQTFGWIESVKSSQKPGA